MTKIAMTHQTRASSQDFRAESAPENIGEKKLPEIAWFAACSTITINTLPRALLNNQLTTMTAANQHDVGEVNLSLHHER